MRAGLPGGDPKRGVRNTSLQRAPCGRHLFILPLAGNLLATRVVKIKKARCCGLAASFIAVRAGLPGGDPKRGVLQYILAARAPCGRHLFILPPLAGNLLATRVVKIKKARCCGLAASFIAVRAGFEPAVPR